MTQRLRISGRRGGLIRMALEVWSVGGLDYLPSEGFSRDVVALDVELCRVPWRFGKYSGLSCSRDKDQQLPRAHFSHYCVSSVPNVVRLSI